MMYIQYAAAHVHVYTYCTVNLTATPLCNQSLCYLIIDQSTGLKVEENSACLYIVCSSHAHNNITTLKLFSSYPVHSVITDTCSLIQSLITNLCH